MNLLPFVVIVMVILSLFSLSQIQKSSLIFKEATCYTGYFETLRLARNALEKNAYEAELKKLNKRTSSSDKKPQPNPSPDPNPSKTPLITDRYTFQSEGSLNLWALLSPTPQDPQIEEIAALYLTAVYGHADFFPKDPQFPRLFLKHLIEVQKNHTHPLPLHKIAFNNPELQEIFYKMQRGTQTYKFKSNVGYPPLSKILTFEKDKKSLLRFDLANVLLLEIFIEREATETLLQKEKTWEKEDDNPYCHLRNIHELEKCLNLSLSDQSRKRTRLLDFSRSKNPKKPHEQLDPVTNITVRID